MAQNILNRNFHTNLPGQKWVSDITYIPTQQGWMYLTIIMDLYDRKIIGWSLSTTMATHDTVLLARARLNEMETRSPKMDSPMNLFHKSRFFSSYTLNQQRNLGKTTNITLDKKAVGTLADKNFKLANKIFGDAKDFKRD